MPAARASQGEATGARGASSSRQSGQVSVASQEWASPSLAQRRANLTSRRSLGVKGDDATDDTAALQRAIDTHAILYLPIGRYRITDTLRLRPDTVLIALHPSLTHLYLPEDVPAYAGVGGAKAPSIPG